MTISVILLILGELMVTCMMHKRCSVGWWMKMLAALCVSLCSGFTKQDDRWCLDVGDGQMEPRDGPV